MMTTYCLLRYYIDVQGVAHTAYLKIRIFRPCFWILKWIFHASLLTKTFKHCQVFVGLGFPYEGPAPLEAVANGAAFLNPKVSRGNATLKQQL